MDADVVGGLDSAGGVAGPRCRHHDRRAGGDAVAQGLEHPDVGGVARPEVVAGDDHQTVVGRVPEAFGEGDLVGHRGDATGTVRTSRPPRARARQPRRRGPPAANSRANVRVGFDRQRCRRNPAAMISMLTNVSAPSVGEEVHVAEQSAVVVAADDVTFDPDPDADREQRRGERARLGAVALDRAVRLLRLGRVDADQPHAFVAPADPTSIVSPSTTCRIVAVPSFGVRSAPLQPADDGKHTAHGSEVAHRFVLPAPARAPSLFVFA